VKQMIVTLLILGFGLLCTLSEARVQRVHGFYRSNGTYVRPYHRTSANGIKNDNYSSRGNVNPFTGKTSTVKRHRRAYY
jgi:hypothetical protein